MACGCPPNDSTLITGPQGDPGTAGADATCTDGTDAQSRIDTSFGEGISTEEGSFITIGYMIFPGTANLPQAINKIYAIASTTASAQIRVITSVGTVATSALFFSGGKALIDLGSITSASLSAGVQLLEIQALSNSGLVEIFALSLLNI